jgi:hypothetical protein
MAVSDDEWVNKDGNMKGRPPQYTRPPRAKMRALSRQYAKKRHPARGPRSSVAQCWTQFEQSIAHFPKRVRGCERGMLSDPPKAASLPCFRSFADGDMPPIYMHIVKILSIQIVNMLLMLIRFPRG